MKKLFRYLLVIFGLSAFTINAQTVNCTFTTCSQFQNNDLRQLYGLMKQILQNSTVMPTGNATENKQDTNVKVLRQIRTDSYSGGFSSGALLNSISNNSSGIYNETFYSRKGIDTINSQLRANETLSVVNTVTVAPHTVSVTNAVNVSTLCGLTNLNTLATLAKQNQAITSATVSEGYLASMESAVANFMKQSLDTINQSLRITKMLTNSQLTFTFFTGANATAIKTAFDTWKSANPTSRVYRTEIISPSVATRELYIEFKP